MSQAYTAFHLPTTAQFAGTTFSMGSNTVKWSINITGSSEGQPFTVRYQLTSLLAIQSQLPYLGGNSSLPAVITRSGQPMTTYFLPLSASSSGLQAELTLFDVVVVDGQLVSLKGQKVLFNSTTLDYTVVLIFPPFSSSLFYDPTLSLGKLLQANQHHGGGVNLLTAIIASTVPAAVVIAILIGVSGTIISVIRRKRNIKQLRRYRHHFNEEDEDSYKII